MWDLCFPQLSIYFRILVRAVSHRPCRRPACFSSHYTSYERISYMRSAYSQLRYVSYGAFDMRDISIGEVTPVWAMFLLREKAKHIAPRANDRTHLRYVRNYRTTFTRRDWGTACTCLRTSGSLWGPWQISWTLQFVKPAFRCSLGIVYIVESSPSIFWSEVFERNKLTGP